MDLDAHRARRVFGWAHFVQAQDFARRVVELVMVDLDVREGCIELHVDVALPGSELEGRHSGGAWAGFRYATVYDVQQIYELGMYKRGRR